MAPILVRLGSSRGTAGVDRKHVERLKSAGERGRARTREQTSARDLGGLSKQKLEEI